MYTLLCKLKGEVKQWALYSPEGFCVTTWDGPLETQEFVLKQVKRRIGDKEFKEESYEGKRWPAQLGVQEEAPAEAPSEPSEATSAPAKK